MSDQEITNTISKYHMEMMLSRVLVSERQYKPLHLIVEKAKQALKQKLEKIHVEILSMRRCM
jgi:hypothetical protein